MAQERSCVRRLMSASENSKKPRQESCDISFLKKNMELFLDYTCLPMPGVEDRDEFTWDILCSWLLLLFICLYGKHALPHAGCPPLLACLCGYTWLFTPQSLMLWSNLAVAWDFGLPHLSVPFSQNLLLTRALHRHVSCRRDKWNLRYQDQGHGCFKLSLLWELIHFS